MAFLGKAIAACAHTPHPFPPLRHPSSSEQFDPATPNCSPPESHRSPNPLVLVLLLRVLVLVLLVLVLLVLLLVRVMLLVLLVL